MNTWDDPSGPVWDSLSPLALWDLLSTGKKGHMTNLQIDDVLGFGDLLRAAANEHKAKLIAKEYDPTAKIASTATASAALGTAKIQTKAKHDEAEAMTTSTDELKQSYYETLSSWCDMMAGALGKKSAEGSAILEIRANLAGDGPTPPPEPPAPPPP